MFRTTRRVFLPLCAIAIASCVGKGVIDPGEQTQVEGTPSRVALTSEHLRPIADCSDLQSTLELYYTRLTEEGIAKNRQTALETLSSFNDWCVQPANTGGGGCGCGGGSILVANTDRGDTYQYDDFSTTNNQVAGVDEADFVENDGGHIYQVAGDQLVILAAFPADNTRVVSSTPIEGRPTRLFVEHDRAVIFAHVADEADCDGTELVGDGHLRITVLDVSDLTAPRIEREIDLDGTFVDARRIGS
ncbi:beta-propeller domain-containing protein, partial [Myxococcota bacterium]